MNRYISEILPFLLFENKFLLKFLYCEVLLFKKAQTYGYIFFSHKLGNWGKCLLKIIKFVSIEVLGLLLYTAYYPEGQKQNFFKCIKLN